MTDLVAFLNASYGEAEKARIALGISISSLVISIATLAFALATPKLQARRKARYDRIVEEDLQRFRQDGP